MNERNDNFLCDCEREECEECCPRDTEEELRRLHGLTLTMTFSRVFTGDEMVSRNC